MVLDLINPSEKELNRLGINKKTYVENYFFTAKMGGICRWSDLYSFLFFSTLGLSFVSGTVFIVFIYFQGEKESVLELVHFMFLLINTFTQVTVYHINQDYYLQLFRNFDKGVFDYGDSLDDAITEEIAAIKREAKERKRKFGFFYASLLKVAIVAQTVKKPLNWLMVGGKHPVDGGDNLMWESTIGLYMPFAEYWAPYIFGLLLSAGCGILLAITAVATTTTYQYISEEFLAEYAIVKLTFQKCVIRAEHLHMTRKKQVEFNACLRICLVLSVKHHQKLISMFNMFKKMMFVPLFMVIFDGGLVLCISSYLTISDDVSMQLRLSMPTLISSNCLLMLIYCHYGERLSAANMDVGDGLYNAEKLSDHLNIMKPFALVVKRFTDIPNELSAGGFSALTHVTFANIIRTAYSYIGFMLST